MWNAAPKATGPSDVVNEWNDSEGPVLAVFAHPDDAEISTGGTLAKWAAQGREIHLLILTNGDRGSEDPNCDRAELAVTRAEEQGEAAKVLGLNDFRILDNHDGELQNIPEVRRQIVRTIREVRPQVVVTADPTTWFIGNRFLNHPDHRMAGGTVLDSIFPSAGNPTYFPEQLAEGLEAWHVPVIRFAWTTEPNIFEDITGFLDTKLAALREHRSQIKKGQLQFFEQWMPLDADEAGRLVGVQHAEQFRQLQR
jgi:LmbE family N-acetylglucosaminyl deacetylase